MSSLEVQQGFEGYHHSTTYWIFRIKKYSTVTLLPWKGYVYTVNFRWRLICFLRLIIIIFTQVKKKKKKKNINVWHYINYQVVISYAIIGVITNNLISYYLFSC